MSPAGSNIQTVNAFEVKIAGSALSGTLAGALTLVEVEQRLNGPSWAIITFHDTAIEGGSVMDDAGIQIGKPVEISAKASESGSMESIFKGDLTSIDFEVEAGASYVSIKAHSKLQRLYHGSKVESRLNMKYSDAVSALAGQHGLTAHLEDTADVFEHVPQGALSNGDLLARLAAEIGYVFYSWDDKLHFRKPAWSGQSVVVSHGENLLRFRSSTSAEPAATKVEVRSWDVEGKRAIVGTARGVKTNGASLPKDPAEAFKTYGNDAPLVVSAPMAPTKAVADTIAQAIADRIGDAGSYAEGLVLGNPAIKPDALVEVDKVPAPVKAKYYVTAVRHLFVDGEYQTEFRCSGTTDPGLNGLSKPIADNTGAVGSFASSGLVVLQGIVTNNDYSAGKKGDHASKHVPAVKVKFPSISDDKESDWYRLVQPGAGPERGMLVMPEVNDEVLVAFAGGDLRNGFVLGGLYNGKDKPGKELGSPPKVVNNGAVDLRGFVTRAGHQIILDDRSGEERILIMDQTGEQQLLFTSKDSKILVQTKEEKVELDGQGKKINVESKGDITIKADGKINLEAKADIVMKSSTGKASLESATGDLELKGMNVKADAKVKFEAKGTAGANLESPAITVVKGSMVQIN